MLALCYIFKRMMYIMATYLSIIKKWNFDFTSTHAQKYSDVFKYDKYGFWNIQVC